MLAIEAAWQADGFTVWPDRGEFVPSFVRFYSALRDGGLVFRAAVLPLHCNGADRAHGGFLSTLADVWLGYSVAAALPPEERFATANIAVDFLRPVPAGCWIEGRAEHLQTGRRLCFASGLIRQDAATPVLSMRATFARLGTTRHTPPQAS